jgi:hypothetical protein
MLKTIAANFLGIVMFLVSGSPAHAMGQPEIVNVDNNEKM